VPITAIIVNYNTGELLSRCLDTLFDSTLAIQAVVIDNHSVDDSLQRARQQHGNRSGLQFIDNADNPGFAVAVNQGLRHAGSDDVLVLNPDCMLEPDTLLLLTTALEADPRAALAAPLVVNADGVPEKASFRRLPNAANSFFTLSGMHRLGKWVPGFSGISITADELPASTTVAEAVSGACLLIRRTALGQVGEFDENYRLHCEDLDLMCRFGQAGWHCLFVPAARAVHHQGRSSRSRPLWVHYQKYRGMQRYYRKFQAAGQGWPMRALVQAGIWLHFLLFAPVALLRR
jgi:GT2 family glycosyltransferase